MNEQISFHDWTLASYLRLTRYPRTLKFVTRSWSTKIRILKGVFDPVYAFTTHFLVETLTKKQNEYRFEHAFDMGCGTGVIAIMLRETGIAKKVDAYDKNLLAVRNARININSKKSCLGTNSNICVLHSDLFYPLGQLRFSEEIYDGGVFNHTYLPQSAAQAIWNPSNSVGGRELLENFFIHAKKFVKKDSPILMPYSEIVGKKHCPQRIAQSLGFQTTIIAKKKDCRGFHYIYEIRV